MVFIDGKSWREDQPRAIQDGLMDDLFDSLISDFLEPDVSSAGPVLFTARVKLRPLQAADAPAFHRLINDWDICRKLPDAPFPYPAALAGEWIAAAGTYFFLGLLLTLPPAKTPPSS